MKTYVYVDAFNLYYGAVKGTPYKWLDLQSLCRVMIPKNTVTCIKYFTARVQPRADDPDQPTRQLFYLRALQTIPNLRIIFGHYLSHVVWMPLAFPVTGQKPFVQVVKTEEKGSDVNLATHLLTDAFDDAFECAVIVSGDSDLRAPIRVVLDRFHKTVGVLNPQKVPCKALQSTARFYKHIHEPALQASQFPPVLTDKTGSFHKPASW
ncbi:MAG: NYN domain-containing protein [Lentisphaerae bacterium]|nr:NYN domain-containing protein [Lentisphaerota bacterium]